MDIEKIEKLLSNLYEQTKDLDIPVPQALPMLQCYLLLHIYKKLESIDDSLGSLDKEIWDARHNQ